MKFNIIYLLLVIFTYCSSIPQSKPLNGSIDLQGHRGARGLKPENTIPAFEEALKRGMTTLELDTVVTKDKELIVHHDSEINPTICKHTEGKVLTREPISNWTVAELKKLDCGELKNPNFPDQTPVKGTQLSTLKEFFDFVKDYEKKNKTTVKVKFNIETKFPNNPTEESIKEFAALMVSKIEESKMVERSTVQSFTIEVLPLIKEKNPSLKTSALFVPSIFQGIRLYLGLGSGLKKDILEKTKIVGADIVSPYFLYVDKEFVHFAHNMKIEVLPWTVNTKKEMLRLKELGVDGIISDYPDKLQEIFL
ncbi:MAG: glycerophosphodiester phosphodiesterase, partial [Leptospiraceae bacterium]|nr:glycerophosphodiester phosphodiesterase [Leptospiraceae bacterium]